MKNLKEGHTEHHNNKKIKSVVKQLNKLMEPNTIFDQKVVKFGYSMDNEGVGGIYVKVKYSEGLYAADHSIETEKPNEISQKDIYNYCAEIFNQIIDQISEFMIKPIEN